MERVSEQASKPASQQNADNNGNLYASRKTTHIVKTILASVDSVFINGASVVEQSIYFMGTNIEDNSDAHQG
jgi:hypothetical protein